MPFRQDLSGSIIAAQRSIRHAPVETAFVFDREESVLLVRQGKVDEIEFTDDEVALMEDNLVIHNHPGGTSFSYADVEFARRYRLGEFRVVTHDWIFAMQAPTAGWAAVAEHDLLKAFELQQRIAARLLAIEVVLGQTANDVAERSILDRVWRLVAGELGVRYRKERWPDK